MSEILLVEDDARIASFVRRGLEAEGFAVDVAADGSDALALAEQNGYALIILDRMLPGLDGLEVCRALRASGRDSMILMLTAKSAEADRRGVGRDLQHLGRGGQRNDERSRECSALHETDHRLFLPEGVSGHLTLRQALRQHSGGTFERAATCAWTGSGLTP